MAKSKGGKTMVAGLDQVKDRLTEEEIAAWTAQDFYQPGVPYLWVLTHGWCCVGFFVKMPDPFTLRIAHASYYRSAGNQTTAALATQGGNDATTWEYHGDEQITRAHIIRVTPYRGIVHRGT